MINTIVISHGCPRDNENPNYENANDVVSGVRCCDNSTGVVQCCSCPDCHSGSLNFKCTANANGCDEYRSKSASEATQICYGKGMRLCYPHELLTACCGSGCGLNKLPVWVLGKQLSVLKSGLLLHLS